MPPCQSPLEPVQGWTFGATRSLDNVFNGLTTRANDCSPVHLADPRIGHGVEILGTWKLETLSILFVYSYFIGNSFHSLRRLWQKKRMKRSLWKHQIGRIVFARHQSYCAVLHNFAQQWIQVFHRLTDAFWSGGILCLSLRESLAMDILVFAFYTVTCNNNNMPLFLQPAKIARWLSLYTLPAIKTLATEETFSCISTSPTIPDNHSNSNSVVRSFDVFTRSRPDKRTNLLCELGLAGDFWIGAPGKHQSSTWNCEKKHVITQVFETMFPLL